MGTVLPTWWEIGSKFQCAQLVGKNSLTKYAGKISCVISHLSQASGPPLPPLVLDLLPVHSSLSLQLTTTRQCSLEGTNRDVAVESMIVISWILSQWYTSRNCICLEINIRMHSVDGTKISKWEWYSHYNEQYYSLVPCKFKTEYDVTSAIIYSTRHVYVCCVTCPRNGPSSRDLRDPLGQWRDQSMLPPALTMERSTPSCWLLGDGITMTTLCRMHGSWMFTLGGGGRWVVMCIWMCDWFNWPSVQYRLAQRTLCWQFLL